ncbi:TrkH family potassium uptake protein [Lentibacter algarum]|uniref:TrkH family potassium uptake protein n=1 Tax=Lentibacter algarum TaxID=576131 RepID=UPI001C07EA37|nr:potassium transporter TrkG [Lentibacter algarum]MBU2982307.1 TrkH family potassium uptake protein [Lentibacter algarum]
MLRFHEIPLFLQLTLLASLSMFVPAVHASIWDNHHEARVFLYGGTLGVFVSTLVAITMQGNGARRRGGLGSLAAVVAAYFVLPVLLAFPFYEAVQTTSFLNAYFEMVSAFTTTGAPLFEPGRLSGTMHLWRAQVAWLGGLFVWVSAAAVLAPLALGGFEVTASAEPGSSDTPLGRFEPARDAHRLARVVVQLAPLYVGLTFLLGFCLVVSGDSPLVAAVHAMSTMSTSGISATGGLEGSSSGVRGEFVVFLFLLFALSRLTFSTDTITSRRQGLHNDPEFRMAVLILFAVTLLLFMRHWFAAREVNADENAVHALRALWGSIFTVLSFLTTAGFESADWDASRGWSGLGAPGLILLGLALTGGGVATTAGGVKLLRVYALYLNGVREMERLVHPSSVGRSSNQSRRIRRNGAFIAWIFFMLFALSLAFVTLVLAANGVNLEEALILSIAALSTTGPLVHVASDLPITLADIDGLGKLILCAAMVVGRLETLAIIALMNPVLWRD